MLERKQYEPTDNAARLCIKCSVSARAVLEKLLGRANVVVENDDAWGASEQLYLYYQLKKPAETIQELAALELVREFVAKLTDGDPSDVPPEQLNPEVCRIISQNPDARLNLIAALQILFRAVNGGEKPGPQPGPAQSQPIAVTFLEKLRPGGPGVLTAIVPDSPGPPDTVTVYTADQVETFIRDHNGKAGLYYSVNPTRTPLSKKAKKTDIAAIEYALADLDPADGETPEAAKARYLAQLNDSFLSTFEPRPTMGLDSGNGIQCLWRLKERIVLGKPVNGKFSPEDQAKIDDVEARIAAVMLRLGAKAGTQNIDRILRLPGTTNLPNAKKRKDGRVACQTKLLWFDDVSYPLDAFPKEKPSKEKPATESKSDKIDWAKVREPGWLKSVEDLPSDVSDKLRRIVGHTGTLDELNDDLIEGYFLDKPYESWSEVTFAITSLLKFYAKHTLEEIAEALLADLPCNQHIAEQKDKKRAVERAITRSHSPEELATAGVKFRDLDKYRHPKPSLANAVIAIRALGVLVSQDLFHNRIFVSYNGDSKTIREGLLTDDTISAVRSLINNTYKIDCGDNLTLAAIKEVARDNAFDPVLDMLAEFQTQWDGTKRLATWTTVYLGCENTPLNRAIGMLTLIAACRRARYPGCKFDQITVLEGPEGIDKSTAIRVLAGDENFSDASIIGADAKEVQEQLDGVWMHENADLDGMRRADVTKVKNFARRQVDRARPAYGRGREDRPRRSIEWGSTNEELYLFSQTGNRSFWQLKTGKIDTKALIRDRAQLLGEAATYEAADKSIVLDKKLWDAAREAQEQRRVTDPWEDILEDELHPTFGPGHTIHKSDDGFERVATAEVLRIILGIENAQQTSAHGQRLALVMKRIGWERPPTGRVRIQGMPVRGYVRRSAVPATTTTPDVPPPSGGEDELAPEMRKPLDQKTGDLSNHPTNGQTRGGERIQGVTDRDRP